MIRIAAVGDLHFAQDMRGRLAPHLEAAADRADLLALLGDLTNVGSREQAQALADELRPLAMPCVAVLGNHDHHSGQAHLVRAVLEDAGVRVLEGESVRLTVAGRSLGVAGVKGFGGGFPGACGHAFGEDEMKLFMRASERAAEALELALYAQREADFRVALTHYAPVKDTLAGERLEIYPFLGAFQLGAAIDRGGAHLALHGHAHHGSERGVTPRGVPVRNVAQPLLRRPFAVYCLDVTSADGEPALHGDGREHVRAVARPHAVASAAADSPEQR